MPHLELIDDEYIGVSFQYDRGIVQQLRRLNARRWNPEKRRWEVHIVHLADVMKIFHLRPEDVPPEVVKRYQSQWIRAKAVVRVGNSFTQLEGGQLPIEKIDEATSFLVYGYHFNLKFLDGKWDGRKHLFDRRNFTLPTGLLHRALAVLRQEGIGFEIDDHREHVAEEAPELEEPGDWTQHVREAVSAALKARRGLLELARGSGKWDFIAGVTTRLGQNAVFFTSGRAALERTVRAMRERLGRSIGQAGGNRATLGPFTVISTPAACEAFGIRLGKHHAGEDPIDDEFDVTEVKAELALAIREAPVVFFDEVHTIPADTVYQLVMRCAAAECRFGLSAAPHRADGHDMLLEAGFGPFFHHTDISTLIENGLAVPARVSFIQPQSYPPCERDREPEEIFERAILTNENRHVLVAQQARHLAEEGRHVVVLAHDPDHARRLVEKTPMGELFEGSADADERKRARAILANPKSKTVIVAPPGADYVLDEPEVTGVVMACACASETKALERICRSLTPAPGKNDVRIIDFYEPLPYLKERCLKRVEILRAQPALQVETVGFTV